MTVSFGFVGLPGTVVGPSGSSSVEHALPVRATVTVSSEDEIPPGVAAELAALRAEIADLRAMLLRGGEAARARTVDGDADEGDPYLAWIRSHLDDLQTVAPAHVAVDPQRGIVAWARTQDEFADKLRALGPDGRAKVTTFHTSMVL